MLGRRLLLDRQRCSDADRALRRDLVDNRQLAQHQRYAEQLPLRRDVHVGVGVLGRRLLLQRQRHFSDLDRALGRDLVGNRQLAQHQQRGLQLPLWRDVRVGVGVLGRWLLLHRRQFRRSDPDRALGRVIMVDRQLAQHQYYGGQRPFRRDVRVSVGVLGRRLLLRTRRPHFSDPDRALGRVLVDHCQLAQHQHAVQCPLRRDVRVGVRLLGRWRLRFHGQCSSDPDRALGRVLVGHRQLAQHQHYAVQLALWCDVRAAVGLLGCRLLHRRRRQQPQSDPDRALGRDLVGHRQLAQHQHYAVQLAL